MRIKKIIILSHILNAETPLYSGAMDLNFQKRKSINNNDSCNTMHWSFPNHAGTHVDVPKHFIDDAKTVADYIAKEWFFEKIRVLDINLDGEAKIIDKNDIERVDDCELLLIRTGFEKLRAAETYWRRSPGLHSDIANALIKDCPSLRAVGIDFISVSSPLDRQLGRAAHKAFLEKNILLIEDMKLAQIEIAPDLIIVSPIRVEEADASPCTVFGIYF
ncbi:cyclase family protein [Candidatus Falkowbacteria bacterium]|nr:cyclase family protein [Candidatus Falkowbacteria bacterium]